MEDESKMSSWSVCRLCDKSIGEPGGPAKTLNVFQKNDSGMQIVNMIKECLPIVIYRTDPLSKLICVSCADTLTVIHNFKTTALEVLKKHSEDLQRKSADNTKVQLYLDNLKNQQLSEECREMPKKPLTTDKSVSTELNGFSFTNGLFSEDTNNTGSDMELCEPGEITDTRIIITRRKRRRTSTPDEDTPLVKRKRIIGPKSKIKNPRIKTVTKTVFNPLSLLECAVYSMNKSNEAEDFDGKCFKEETVEEDEVISYCFYCETVFENDAELAKHELEQHIKLRLERVDAFELWDPNESYAVIRNRWLKRSLDIEESTEDDEEDDDDDDTYEGEETEGTGTEEDDNLLVPLNEDEDREHEEDETEEFHLQFENKVSNTRNPDIVYINQQPCLDGVLVKDIPKDERQDFYQSVTLNGVKRKFCNLCRYTFKDHWAIELHYMSRTCYYSCNYCGGKYNKSKHEFEDHIKYHEARGDKKSNKVFVNRSKSSTIPQLVDFSDLRPYVPGPSRYRNKVKPIQMRSLFEKRRGEHNNDDELRSGDELRLSSRSNSSTENLRIRSKRNDFSARLNSGEELTSLRLKTKEELGLAEDYGSDSDNVKTVKDGIKLEPVTRKMTTVDLAKSSSQAYFCKKCYQVFPKINEYNEHQRTCNGEIDDPAMHLIRPYNKKDTTKRNYNNPTLFIKEEIPKPDSKILSPTGRPVRHCVRDVVSYNDDRDPEEYHKNRQLLNQPTPGISTPGRFECNFCASVFPTVHSRNSHMRIHKSGFKHAPGKSPAVVAPQNYQKIFKTGVKIKTEPMDEDEQAQILNKSIKQETFEPIVEIHEGPSKSQMSNIGSVSITPLGRNAQKQMSPALMQLVQNNPNITIKTKNKTQNNLTPNQQNFPSPSQSTRQAYSSPSSSDANNVKYQYQAQDGETRSYKCSSCSKPFANKSNLYFHKKNQCGGSKYPCPFCKKRFGTEASYSSHIFYSHPV